MLKKIFPTHQHNHKLEVKRQLKSNTRFCSPCIIFSGSSMFEMGLSIICSIPVGCRLCHLAKKKKKNQSYLLFNPQIFWVGAKWGKIFSLSLPFYIFYQLILALTAGTRLNSSITYSLLNIRDRRLGRVSLTCILFRFSGNWKSIQRLKDHKTERSPSSLIKSLWKL